VPFDSDDDDDTLALEYIFDDEDGSGCEGGAAIGNANDDDAVVDLDSGLRAGILPNGGD
jgi:hypothetical protein